MARFEFDGFVLDPRRRVLSGPDGSRLPLTGRAFDTLLYLLRNRERVVGKDELMAQVWPGRVVEENNLTQAISAIRRALGVVAGEQRFVRTVPGHGYHFVAQVTVLGDPPDPADVLGVAAGTGSAADGGPDAATPGLETPAARLLLRRRRSDTWRRPLLAGTLALAVLAGVVAWRQRSAEPLASASSASSLSSDATLAVLPFVPVDGGEPDPLLALGLADTLINRIGRSTTLQVRSIASSQRYLDHGADPLVAARELHAAYVLEGTTQRSGAQVRVGVRLRDAGDGRVLWSDSFDERADRVFTLQDRVAEELRRVLALKFSASRGTSPCDGANAEAYRAVLGGQYQMFRPNAQRLGEALQDYRRAIELDPTCARAYAGMGFVHRALVMTADHAPTAEFPVAKAAIAKAMAINPDLAEAHASKGFVEFWYDWDWEASEASFRRAISLNPSSAEAHFGYAHLLGNIGRIEEAAAQARQAIALDPLSPLINTIASGFIAAAGGRDEAARILDGVAERDPDYWTVWMMRGQRLAAQGKRAEANLQLQRAVEGCGGCSQALMALGISRAMGGDRAGAQAVLARLEAKRKVGYAPLTALAAVHAALGEKEDALALLEGAFAERDVRMTFLARDTYWNTLRKEPRFRVLMQRMRLREPPAPSGGATAAGTIAPDLQPQKP